MMKKLLIINLMDVLQDRDLSLSRASCEVTLVDVMPRIVQRSMEDSIIISARMSTGNSLKSKEQDEKLVLYLLKNAHTSPLESVKFSFHIKCPIFVARQLIRHRTANINEFSQRYAETDLGRYKPIDDSQGIRLQCQVNKQSSITGEISEEIRDIFLETESLLDKIEENYHRMISLGVAREVARFCLPMSSWTKMSFTLDLNNYLKFLRLRLDSHAQKEIRDVAECMWELTKDLIPTVRDYFENEMKK